MIAKSKKKMINYIDLDIRKEKGDFLKKIIHVGLDYEMTRG